MMRINASAHEETEGTLTRRRWWALAVVVAAQFMFVVDAFVVNIAVPSIRADIQATTGEMQGVIAIYQIAFAGLIIAGGRLGDMRGPKPAFLFGVAAFTAASLWCGLSQTGLELVAARAVQGMSAAIMVPQVLTTIHVLFPIEERHKAFGIYGSTLGLGAAVGFLAGGLLLSLNLNGWGWRTIFFVNLPLGGLLLASGFKLMPNLAGRPNEQFDYVGAIVLFVALVSIVAPLSFGVDFNWTPGVFIGMAIGVSLLISLWPLEQWVTRRRRRLPILHLDLFQDTSFVLGLGAIYFFTFANLSFYLVLTLYLQLGLALSPLATGLTVLPLALTFALVSRLSGSRVKRRGLSALIEGGVLQIIGLALPAALLGLYGAVSPILLSLLLAAFGAGQAMVMAPLYGTVLSNVPAAHAGTGGGVISTVQQVGNSCGIVVVGSVFYAIQNNHAADTALVFSLGVLVLALFATVGFLQRLRTAQHLT